MHAAIVIPCLNEQATLAATCATLGFGMHASPPAPGTFLVLVDNGSIDGTPAVMEAVRRSAPDQVLVASEPRRGYVPPRDRGARAACEAFAERGVPPEDVLVIQADADTDYAPGYVGHLLASATGCGPGALLEGLAKPPPMFRRRHPGYHQLAEAADLLVEPFLVDEADEIIVDDQGAAYRLSDYVAWGGHRQEYDAAGDEIHAETSRLYLRARSMGAHRVRVAQALAYPSRRKVEQNPELYFATAGFPREARWLAQWTDPLDPMAEFAAFESAIAPTICSQAILLRQAHTMLLFGVLPAYLAWLEGRYDRRAVLETPLGDLVSSLSGITAADVVSNPGRLFAAALPLVDERLDVFEACVEIGQQRLD